MGVDSLKSMRRNYESDSGLLLGGIAFEKSRRGGGVLGFGYSAALCGRAAPRSLTRVLLLGRPGGLLCLLLLPEETRKPDESRRINEGRKSGKTKVGRKNDEDTDDIDEEDDDSASMPSHEFRCTTRVER